VPNHHGNVGNLLCRTGRDAEADGECRQALALRRELADANPNVPV
jgi:hypothetical protein